ncbi:hypothetical protein [Shewanella sp.]|uniref:hypothetical protein n=1 Tax=Shewanella sp. TaxID=50422 RepID=UPI001EC791CC|nr:hypothetical protein [Shewanella sp.]NRB23746.1 hypothetical protein [Shewanella sp.]
MKPLLVLCSMLILLFGCASPPDDSLRCGVVSGYLDPDLSQDLYRTVVTHLDGKPVISKPNYRLSPGEHTFTFAELISAPSLKVKLAARTPKDLVIRVESNRRYHFAAKFNTDKRYRGNDSGFWQPVIWLEEAHECTLPVN